MKRKPLYLSNKQQKNYIMNVQDQGKAIARIVKGNIEDKKANGEFVEPKYYELKEYFNAFDLPVDSMLFTFALKAL